MPLHIDGHESIKVERQAELAELVGELGRRDAANGLQRRMTTFGRERKPSISTTAQSGVVARWLRASASRTVSRRALPSPVRQNLGLWLSPSHTYCVLNAISLSCKSRSRSSSTCSLTLMVGSPFAMPRASNDQVVATWGRSVWIIRNHIAHL